MDDEEVFRKYLAFLDWMEHGIDPKKSRRCSYTNAPHDFQIMGIIPVWLVVYARSGDVQQTALLA